MKKSIIITGSAILFTVFFMFAIYLLGSCTSKPISIEQTQLKELLPIDEGIISVVPNDGREHIIYKSEWQVIKCKVIYIKNSYTTHIVWVETSCKRCTGNGEIKILSTH